MALSSDDRPMVIQPWTKLEAEGRGPCYLIPKDGLIWNVHLCVDEETPCYQARTPWQFTNQMDLRDEIELWKSADSERNNRVQICSHCLAWFCRKACLPLPDGLRSHGWNKTSKTHPVLFSCREKVTREYTEPLSSGYLGSKMKVLRETSFCKRPTMNHRSHRCELHRQAWEKTATMFSKNVADIVVAFKS